MAGLPTVSTTPAEVASQLQARGVSSDDAHTAATEWGAAQAGVSTINAVVGIAHGRADAASLSPLLAVGVTAATANPLAGAIVAGAIPIAGGILSELFGSPSNACSGWFVGSWCFPAPRPRGRTMRRGKRLPRLTTRTGILPTRVPTAATAKGDSSADTR